MSIMATQSSLQDCYFYFYSSCTKGDECPFRHCELALGTETVCSLWREGRCFRNNCKFRHMESRINRSTIPCYWENQPSGCRKPHCVFLHQKVRNGVQVIKDTPGLILPTSDGKISPKLPDLTEISNVSDKISLVEKVVEIGVAPDPSLIPVPPLVLNFDENEESDSESVTSTPVKQGDKKTALTINSSVKALGALEEKDFGIKTLEQIRMEKIHKESDSYYGAAYTSVPLEALIDQHYPPKSEYLVLPKDLSLENNLPASITEPKLSEVDEETDLRGRLSNRRNISSNKVNQVKRLINFKKQNTSPVEVGSNKMDFKIKTLAEIRKEKENKQQNKSEDGFSNIQNDLLSSEKRPLSSTKEKTFKKLKINRKSREMDFVSSVLKQNISTSNAEEAVPTSVISNGIKEIPNRLSEKPNEITSSDLSDKRKIDEYSDCTASKIIKLATISNDNCKQVNEVNACSKATSGNHLQPFLQQPEIHSFAPNEISDRSSTFGTSPSSSHEQDKIKKSQNFVPDIEMNGALTSLSSSNSLPSSATDGKSEHVSVENEHIFMDGIKDKTLNSLPLPTTMKNDLSSDNGTKKGNDNLIDRSISVDEDFDELLGDDDMNVDEIDTAPNDDILLQIEEFLES